MRRRAFLGLIGCGAGAVLAAPVLPVTPRLPATAELALLQHGNTLEGLSGSTYHSWYAGGVGGGKTNAYQRQLNRMYAEHLERIRADLDAQILDQRPFFSLSHAGG